MDLQPKLGTLLGVQARFQLNLIIRKDPAFEPLAHLDQNVTVIPLFWAQEGYDSLPPDAARKLYLALSVPDLFADGLIITCVITGNYQQFKIP